MLSKKKPSRTNVSNTRQQGLISIAVLANGGHEHIVEWESVKEVEKTPAASNPNIAQVPGAKNTAQVPVAKKPSFLDKFMGRFFHKPAAQVGAALQPTTPASHSRV